MDYLPPPQTEIVYVAKSPYDLRDKYRRFVVPLNKLVAHISDEGKKYHSAAETHRIFSQILQLRDDLVTFLKLEEVEKEIINTGNF